VHDRVGLRLRYTTRQSQARPRASHTGAHSFAGTRISRVAHADDVESILAAVRTLIDDLERRKRMAGAAREYIEVRSFEAAFNETWKVYQEKNMA